MKEFNSNFIEDSYVVYMINAIKQHGFTNILDLGQGCQGKTTFYLYQALNKYNRNIVSILSEELTKNNIIEQLELSDIEGSFIHIKETTENSCYNVDWSTFNEQFDFISVDAPYCSDITGDFGRTDIINIINANKLNVDGKYMIMFHDIDNELIMNTIYNVKKILKSNIYSFKKFIILTNVNL